jgi:tRNA (cytidine56-2'-O)-methyltransferase
MLNMEIAILRLGHRLPRDERISTHVALVARAFGASRMIYSGQHDSGLESSIQSLVSSWGGDFTVQYEKNFRKVIKEHKKNGFIVIQLTMYGIPIQETIRKLQTEHSKLETGNGQLLIIVGSEAVPGDIYELADYNIAVTNQPHSEVAALAIVLDRLMDGKELEREFDSRFQGKVRIEPSKNGKKVIKAEDL